MPANTDVCGFFVFPIKAGFDCYSNKCLFSNKVRAVSAENLGGLGLIKRRGGGFGRGGYTGEK